MRAGPGRSGSGVNVFPGVIELHCLAVPARCRPPGRNDGLGLELRRGLHVIVVVVDVKLDR